MVSEAQKRATTKWRKDNIKSFNLQFGPADMDLYEFLQQQGNKSWFIKELLRKEMEK